MRLPQTNLAKQARINEFLEKSTTVAFVNAKGRLYYFNAKRHVDGKISLIKSEKINHGI